MYQCLRHYGFGVFMCLRVFKGSNPVSMSMLAQNRYKHTEGYLHFCTHCVMICHTDLSFSGNIQGGGGSPSYKGHNMADHAIHTTYKTVYVFSKHNYNFNKQHWHTNVFTRI